MSQNIPSKLKILALHGYTQSAGKFREKTYPFQRKVKKYAEFVFITAPLSVPNEFVDEEKSKIKNNIENIDISKNKEIYVEELEEEESVDDSNFKRASVGSSATHTFKNDQNINTSEDTDSYAWYLRKPKENSTEYIYEGLQETVNYLDKVFEEKGPFDGVFGFSQGGCVVGLLCDLQQRNLTHHIKFEFAVIASGFKYEDGDFYGKKLVIPSLHIYGENDKQIPWERSQNLLDCFQSPVTAKHPGGHYIPGNNSLKKEYETFFKDQWLNKFENNKERT